MRWIPDPAGRYPERPYFEVDELEDECEDIVSAFLRARYGRIDFPLTTNDLTVLLERETSDVDLYADLRDEGDDVQGMTEFYRDQKPAVWIDQELTKQSHRENRLRTTLTHELGHVKFHQILMRFDQSDQLSLFGDETEKPRPRCRRETIIGASHVDWLEWQAGYASGAFLMPQVPLTRVAVELLEFADAQHPPTATSSHGRQLIRKVQQAFQVSADAARVRLLQRGILVRSHSGQFSLK